MGAVRRAAETLALFAACCLMAVLYVFGEEVDRT